MSDDRPKLAADLMATAICRTSHPADAASALLSAAGELLHSRFGAAAAFRILRAIIDDTEAAMQRTDGGCPIVTIQ